MRIGLNLLFLIPSHVGGTETYTTSLVDAIHTHDQENQYYLFVNKESKDLALPTGRNFHKILCPFNARNRAMRFFWEQFILPWQALVFHIDVFHSLGYISPLVLPCRSVVTIHDLNFVSVPESFTPFTRVVQRFFVSSSAKRADRIIVVSNFIRDQLVKYLEETKDKVTVIYEAARNTAPFNRDVFLWPDLKEKLALSRPYILAFSSIAPHKNIPLLIEAFEKIRENGVKCQLVVVGLPSKRMPLNKIIDHIGVEEGDVIFTGYLPEQWVNCLLSHARVFVFPSKYEGFGLPVLEAMAAGTVVACSSAGSLPEIAGDAAMFFDPTDLGQMVQTITLLFDDDEKRASLLERGRLNINRFSWARAAFETLNVYSQTRYGLRQ